MKNKSRLLVSGSLVLLLLIGGSPLLGFAESSWLGGLEEFGKNLGKGIKEGIEKSKDKIEELSSESSETSDDSQKTKSALDSSSAAQEQQNPESQTAAVESNEEPEPAEPELPFDPMDFLVGDPTQLSLPPLPKSCGWLGVAGAIGEITLDKNPTVESALERVNTATRFLHLGELLIHLPMSAGSQWPKSANSELPSDGFKSIFTGLVKGAVQGHLVSLNKMRGKYIVETLFQKAPEFVGISRYSLQRPAEDEVQRYGARILGSNFNPEFNAAFDWLLTHFAEYEPKPEVFGSDLDGEPTEIFPSIVKAVHSLAINQDTLLRIEEDISITHHSKVSARKDVEETLWQIRHIKEQQLDQASSSEDSQEQTQTAESPEDRERAEELEELKLELGTQQVRYGEIVKEYEQALKQLEVAISLIKNDQTKLNKEEQALAQNVQHVVEGTEKLMCGAELESIIAGKHLVEGSKNLKNELALLYSQQGSGREKMKGIVLNLVALPWNITIISTELGLLNQRIAIYDDLFEDRVEKKCGMMDFGCQPSEKEGQVVVSDHLFGQEVVEVEEDWDE